MREETELILSLVLIVLLAAINYRVLEVQAGAAPDIHDSFEPVPLAESEQPLLPAWEIVLGAVMVVAASTTGILAYRKRARANPIESAEDRAHRRLAEAATALADPKSLYTELNSILTEYVGARAGISATRRTSLELQQFFESSGLMDVKFQTELAGFLADCDRAKFSPSPQLGWNRERAIADCRTIIATIETSHAAF
jgi:hypothetical protein